jgi:hypothetical protein
MSSEASLLFSGMLASDVSIDPLADLLRVVES